MPGNAMSGHGEGDERSKGQTCERKQELNQRDGKHIQSRGADLPITR